MSLRSSPLILTALLACGAPAPLDPPRVGAPPTDAATPVPGPGAPTFDVEACEATTLSFSLPDRRGGRMLVEAVRGEAIAPVPDDPAWPEHVIDVRVLDARGRLVYSRMGGDAWVEPTWALPTPEGAVDVKARHADLDVLGAVAEEPSAWSTPACAELRDAVAVDLRALATEPRFDADVLVEEADDTALPVVPRSAAASYRHKAHVTWKYVDLYVLGFRVFHHSALKVNIYDAGANFLGMRVTSNHGTAANDPSMATKCYRNESDRANFEPTQGVGCTTSYGVHVCNDDTSAQLQNVHDNVASTGHFTCFNGPWAWAPDCTVL